MKGFFWLVFLATSSSPTLAQLQHGTVAVVYFTKDKIIMAADSRELVRNVPQDDTACKVVAPRGEMVFVSSNYIGYRNAGVGDPVDSWSNNEEIHRAYNTVALSHSSNQSRIVETALEWGKVVSLHFQSLLFLHPEKLNEVVRKGSGVLTIAEMGGLDSDGALIRLETEIKFKEGASPPVFPETTKFTDCPKSYCAIGEIEIEQEFVNLTSERAKEETKSWRPPEKSRPEDYDMLRTMRLVDLTIKYHDGDVGGRVDAVQMDKDGTVRWFAIKENCKKD